MGDHMINGQNAPGVTIYSYVTAFADVVSRPAGEHEVGQLDLDHGRMSVPYSLYIFTR